MNPKELHQCIIALQTSLETFSQRSESHLCKQCFSKPCGNESRDQMCVWAKENACFQIYGAAAGTGNISERISLVNISNSYMQTVKGKLRLSTRAGVSVNGRPSPCFSPVTGWRPVCSVPRLSPNNPELYKQKMVDRMIDAALNNSPSFSHGPLGKWIFVTLFPDSPWALGNTLKGKLSRSSLTLPWLKNQWKSSGRS